MQKNSICEQNETFNDSHKNTSKIIVVLQGAIAAMLSYIASIIITYLCIDWADLFRPASFSYDAKFTQFDNTAYTYMTDYVLGVIMFICYLKVRQYENNNDVSKNSLMSNLKRLLFCYCISVMSGGVGHQFFTSVPDMLNTGAFRVLWTLCVGTVTLAGGFIGAMGSYLAKQQQTIPRISELFWYSYGIVLTIFLAFGGMSMKRPACDIFIAGTTQTLPTVYLALNAWHSCKKALNNQLPLLFYAFFSNAPLLPLYPIMAVYFNMELCYVNTILHCNLAIAWSSQFVAVRRLNTRLCYSGEVHKIA